MVKENLKEEDISFETLEKEKKELEERIKDLEERTQEIEEKLGISKKIYVDQSGVHITKEERKQGIEGTLH